jgi:hypothetical protein
MSNSFNLRVYSESYFLASLNDSLPGHSVLRVLRCSFGGGKGGGEVKG